MGGPTASERVQPVIEMTASPFLLLTLEIPDLERLLQSGLALRAWSEEIVIEILISVDGSQRKISDIPYCVIGIDQQAGQYWYHPVHAGRFLCRLPAHCPGRQRALSRVALECPQHARGDFLLLLGQLGDRLAILAIQRVGRPEERLVQVAGIAGIWTTNRIHAFANMRTADGVAADRFHQTPSGMRHVAVVAHASRR